MIAASFSCTYILFLGIKCIPQSGKVGEMENQPSPQVQATVSAYYAPVIGVGSTGVDVKLTFMDFAPLEMTGEDGRKHRPAIPQCVVSLGLHAAKDLHALLGIELRKHEDEFGELRTVFTMSLPKEPR